MIDRAGPRHARDGMPLGVRDRNEGGIAERVHQREEVRNVEPPVQRGHAGRVQAPRDRQMQKTGVEVDDVEPIGQLRHQLHLADVVCHRVLA